MEFYWAYADYNDGMELTKKLFQEIAKKVFGTTKFESRGYKYDLASKWKQVDYKKELVWIQRRPIPRIMILSDAPMIIKVFLAALEPSLS